MKPSYVAVWTGMRFVDLPGHAEAPQPREMSPNAIDRFREQTDRLIENRVFDTRYARRCFRCKRADWWISMRSIIAGKWLCRSCERAMHAPEAR